MTAPQGQPAEDLVVGRHRAVPVPEAAGTEPVPLATGERGRGPPECGPDGRPDRRSGVVAAAASCRTPSASRLLTDKDVAFQGDIL